MYVHLLWNLHKVKRLLFLLFR